MSYSYLVFIHVVLATIWLGGILTLGGVLVLNMKKLNATEKEALISRLALSFRTIGWMALLGLLLSGGLMLHQKGLDLLSLTSWSSFLQQEPFGKRLYLKLSYFVGILFLSGVHDWFLGPIAVKFRDQASQSNSNHLKKQILYLRILSASLGATSLFFTLILVYHATHLARGL